MRRRRGWEAEYLPLNPIKPGTALPIQLEEVNGSCDVCGKDAFDHCYNCEDAVCHEHGHPWVFAEMGGSGMAFTLCRECVRLTLDMQIIGDIATQAAIGEGVEAANHVAETVLTSFKDGDIPRYVEDFKQVEEGYAVSLRPEEERVPIDEVLQND